MSLRCNACETGDLEEHDGKTVCTTCGVIQSECYLTSESSKEGAMFVAGSSYSQHLYTSGGISKKLIDCNLGEKYPMYMKTGKNKIARLCNALSLGDAVQGYALNLYTQLGDEQLKRRTTDKREVFCCACVFIACREYDLPITMTYISSIESYSVDVYFAAVKTIENALNIKTKPQTIDHLVDSVVVRNLQPNIEATKHVINLTKEVLQLVSDLFLSPGRKPQALIGAAFYLTYQGEDFGNRRKLKHTQVFNKALSKTINASLKLIRPALLELLKGIPWTEKHQHNHELIPHFLADIVRHKKTLIRTALARTQCPADEEDDDTHASATNEESKENRVMSLDGKAAPTRSESELEQHSGCGAEDVQGCRKRPECGENTLFHPPAFKRARERSRERAEIALYVAEGLETLKQLSENLHQAK